MIEYLEQGRTINGAYYAGNLRQLRQEIAQQEEREIDSRYSALAGQHPYPHVTSSHGCCD